MCHCEDLFLPRGWAWPQTVLKIQPPAVPRAVGTLIAGEMEREWWARMGRDGPDGGSEDRPRGPWVGKEVSPSFPSLCPLGRCKSHDRWEGPGGPGVDNVSGSHLALGIGSGPA